MRRIRRYVSAALALSTRSLQQLGRGMPQPHAMRRLYFLTALVVLLLDRVTKWMVEGHIELHDTIQVIPGFFRLTHVQNRGAAFGLFAESPSEWKVGVLVLFSVIAL